MNIDFGLVLPAGPRQDQPNQIVEVPGLTDPEIRAMILEEVLAKVKA
jgi:hypothetical protein